MTAAKKRFPISFAMIPMIFALAGPTMLEQLMQTAVQYIDTAMVGSLGTTATAAVGSTTTVNWLIGGTIKIEMQMSVAHSERTGSSSSVM